MTHEKTLNNTNMVTQVTFSLPQRKRGYHLITSEITKQLPELPESGILHLMIQHTSAALTINENADPTVRIDFETFFRRTVDSQLPYFEHTLEGDDDMPAHIKASIIGPSVSVPITNHRLNLGTWQGIYLCEFRDWGGSRRIVATIVS